MHNWHIEAIAEHLEAVTRRDIKRLIINVPFRTMKSTLVSVMWPAWTWTFNPEHQFLCGSYAAKLAIRDNVKHRRLVKTNWFRERWGHVFGFTEDQNQKIRFENDQTGYRIAFGFDSGVMGDGGDTVLIDDPHDRNQAHSDVERENALITFDEGIITRLNEPEHSAIVLIMQRLHQQDLSGHLLAQGGWEHLMLPMEFDEQRRCVTVLGSPDPRTEEGELLWPERFPAQVVESLKTSLGPYGASGQLQQAPQPRGGGIFKRDWWKVWPPPEVAERLERQGKKIEYPPFDYIVASVDTAYTEKEENDWSACTVWGVWRDEHDLPKLMLCYAWQERLELHELVEKVAKTCKIKGIEADRLLIEAKASGLSVAQEIRRLYADAPWVTQLINPGDAKKGGGDKVARAYSVQAAFSAGLVFAPDRAWADKVIDQMEAFPKTEFKDLTDTAVQALIHLRRGGMLLMREEREADLAERMKPPGVKRPIYDV